MSSYTSSMVIFEYGLLENRVKCVSKNQIWNKKLVTFLSYFKTSWDCVKVTTQFEFKLRFYGGIKFYSTAWNPTDLQGSHFQLILMRNG